MAGERCPCNVMTKMMDSDILVGEFEFQPRYYVQFQTNAPWERYETPYPLLTMCKIEPLMFLYKDGFGIK